VLIPKVEQRIRQYLTFLDRRKFRKVLGLAVEALETREVHRTPPTTGRWSSIELPYPYGREWTTWWFRSHFTLPGEAAGREVYLRITPNADSLVFVNGVPSGALNPLHKEIRLESAGKPGAAYTIHVESYAGHKYPGMHPFQTPRVILTIGRHIDDYPNRLDSAELLTKETVVYDLYYDALALFETAEQLGANSLRRHRILRGLYDALMTVRFTSADGDRTDRGGLINDGGFAEGAGLAGQAAHASHLLAPLLAAKNGDTTPEVLLVGHAHIDHAWLWPIWETERKVARTFANMCRFAQEYPEFIFLQSQPAQLDGVRRQYPQIFTMIKAAYERGQWEPNGGMWVEADCNVTGGESLVRQFLVGKQASREMLGCEGDTLWLPDVFGYAAALPQILVGCEIRYFVTSKINWNDTTRFPYDTFIWKGIDGTGIRTHYITSRMDGYNGKVRPVQLADAWNQVQHKDVQGAVLKPIGEGDGGGGTTRDDLEIARRLADLEGSPRTRWARVSTALERIFERAGDLPEWHGELYLELHRGTYTTQARTKRYNRRLELALRDCEVLYSQLQALPAAGGAGQAGSASYAGDADYPRAELLECWKKLLINQFHDIIPGSSINAVYQEAEARYREIEEVTETLIARAQRLLAARLQSASAAGARDGDVPREPGMVEAAGAMQKPEASAKQNRAGQESRAGQEPRLAVLQEGGAPEGAVEGAIPPAGRPIVFFNTLSWERTGRVVLPWSGEPAGVYALADASGSTPVQVGRDFDGSPQAIAFVRVPSMGLRALAIVPSRTGASPFTVDEREAETPFYRVSFDARGRIAQLVDRESGRELVAEGAVLNAFQSAEDVPILWDAWDIDADWTRSLVDEERLESSETVSSGPLFLQIRNRYRIGKASALVQDIFFYASDRRIDFVTRIDWQESHRLLKVAFPVRLLAERVRCEVQYGHVERNTHENLPQDRARFEFCAHKWICVEEAGFGVALLNDCKYGHDVHGAVMRLTLLRSPKAPDPEADMGTHFFTYSLLPFTTPPGLAEVVRSAYDLNRPLAAVDMPPAGKSRATARSRAEALPVNHDPSAADPAAELSFFQVDDPFVIIEAMKLAEEESGSGAEGGRLVLRLYEAGGGSRRAVLRTLPRLAGAWTTNMLERQAQPCDHEEHAVRLAFRPFEIKTLLLRLHSCGP
jgi:alpha-mannosidase